MLSDIIENELIYCILVVIYFNVVNLYLLSTTTEYATEF